MVSWVFCSFHQHLQRTCYMPDPGNSTGNETGPLSHEETRMQQNGNNLIARLSLRHSPKQRVISFSWVLPWQIGLLGHGSGPNHRILRELLLQSPETQGDSRGLSNPKQTNKQTKIEEEKCCQAVRWEGVPGHIAAFWNTEVQPSSSGAQRTHGGTWLL